MCQKHSTYIMILHIRMMIHERGLTRIEHPCPCPVWQIHRKTRLFSSVSETVRSSRSKNHNGHGHGVMLNLFRFLRRFRPEESLWQHVRLDKKLFWSCVYVQSIHCWNLYSLSLSSSLVFSLSQTITITLTFLRISLSLEIKKIRKKNNGSQINTMYGWGDTLS